MTDDEFVRRIEEDPRLTMLHHDGTICIIRFAGPAGPRDVRVGLWAVRHRHWEQLMEALCIPPEASVA